ncbi:MAG: phosphodiester glycosidase family protein [Fimbriimonadaceae bacterium]|nr:phosphodiester glycosidase family protein [Chthonomonadaceae bacterium]MCO5295743.1 phosphodiester glycosidase family protein [Fimbriimonadaceae bacterium]
MSLAAAAIVLSVGTVTQFAPIGYEAFKYGPNTFHVVTADLRATTLSAATVHSPSLTSPWNLLNLLHVPEAKPIAAITGTFFAPSSQKPVADVLIDGNLVAQGSRGTAVGVDWFGGVKIFDKPYLEPVDWALYQYGLRGAVRVLTAGAVQPNPKAQRFHDSRLWGRAARAGLATTKNGKVLLFATKAKVTLSELGKAMKARGAIDGVSLDGGSSTCLYYKGSMIVPPGRKLSNLFVITQATTPP